MQSSFPAENNQPNNQSAVSSSSQTASENLPVPTPENNSKEPKEKNLLSLSTGAFVVKASSQDNEKSPFYLIDDHVGSYAGMISARGNKSADYVIALPEKTILNELEFWGYDFPGSEEVAKDVVVQMSDVSADAGFETIATVTLDNPTIAKALTFPADKKIAGRWLKVIFQNNHGGEYVGVSEIRGYGERVSQAPIQDVSGTYKANLYYGNGEIILKQNGASVEGCVLYINPIDKSKTIEQLVSGGGMENNALLLFTQNKITSEGKLTESNPAIIIFSPDNAQFYSRIITNKQDPTNNLSQAATLGKRISSDVGDCPQWSGKSSAMADELEKSGRATLYGINFDMDSDVIKQESFPTLDKIVQLAKEKPEWNFAIEGHTDSVADDAYNQKLSVRRANSVKAYLVKAGVDENRLEGIGLGETKPIADNQTEIGRAQNRRVELVKK